MPRNLQRLSELFASALIAAGCGPAAPSKTIDAEGKASLRPCSENPLPGLRPAVATDAIELRDVCGHPDRKLSPGVRLVTGQGCSEGACATLIRGFDARVKGWTYGGMHTRRGCRTYLVGMLGDELVAVVESPVELMAFLGEIDTLQEAELVAELGGIRCLRSGENQGRYVIETNEIISDCPYQSQLVFYRVTPNGGFKALEKGRLTPPSSSCIGRRPMELEPAPGLAATNPLGRYFAEAAELEAASIVAFLVLERELFAHGAPRALCERARKAAADEVRHARAMARLARDFGARPRLRRIRVGPVRELEAIAWENGVEGCVRETWGALVGSHQARAARSESVRAELAEIAGDELGHAALSRDVHDWLEGKLTVSARRRVGEARADAVRALAAEIDEPSPELGVELGVPDRSASERLLATVAGALR